MPITHAPQVGVVPDNSPMGPIVGLSDGDVGVTGLPTGDQQLALAGWLGVNRVNGNLFMDTIVIIYIIMGCMCEHQLNELISKHRLSHLHEGVSSINNATIYNYYS